MSRHANFELGRSDRQRSFAHRFDSTRFILAGVWVMSERSSTFQFLDPNGSDRTVFLPELDQWGGQLYFIRNLSATNVLNVVDADGIDVAEIVADGVMVFFSSKSEWAFLQTPLVFPYVGDVTVTTATHTITSEVSVYVNHAGAVTITLPDATTWRDLDKSGLPLTIKDISGAASANNITINRAGADTIDGLTSLTINQNYGGFKLRPLSGGNWTIV